MFCFEIVALHGKPKGPGTYADQRSGLRWRHPPLICATGLQTTMRYARADLDLKRQALAQVFPDVLGAPKAGGMALRGTELTRWLRRL